MPTRNAGFTLLELVLVIVIAAVLLVSAGGRFFSVSDVNVYQQRDQLIGQLRQLQTRSMHDSVGLTSRCPVLVLTSSGSAQATSNACSSLASYTVDNNDASQLAFNGATLVASSGNLPQLVRFDSWGRPVQYDNALNASLACSAGCSFTFSQDGVSAAVCINGNGYITPC